MGQVSTNINLNNKKFTALSNSENGETSSQTVFHYRQKGNIIWATYEGGNILFGTLSGQRIDGELIFRYQHQNIEGEFLMGKCQSKIEFFNGRIFLKERWQWMCKDFSEGESVLEELME